MVLLIFPSGQVGTSGGFVKSNGAGSWGGLWD